MDAGVTLSHRIYGCNDPNRDDLGVTIPVGGGGGGGGGRRTTLERQVKRGGKDPVRHDKGTD